jgi:Xaa-Pro aminopeptidase
MNLNDDGYKILHDVQKKCNDLNRKIDSIIRIMEIFTAYMQYSAMMTEQEGSETMNPNDFQKIMNAAKQSDKQMSDTEFNQIFETLKQGKSAEEVARMEQMVQIAKSFMK